MTSPPRDSCLETCGNSSLPAALPPTGPPHQRPPAQPARPVDALEQRHLRILKADGFDVRFERLLGPVVHRHIVPLPALLGAATASPGCPAGSSPDGASPPPSRSSSARSRSPTSVPVSIRSRSARVSAGDPAAAGFDGSSVGHAAGVVAPVPAARADPRAVGRPRNRRISLQWPAHVGAERLPPAGRPKQPVRVWCRASTGKPPAACRGASRETEG